MTWGSQEGLPPSYPVIANNGEYTSPAEGWRIYTGVYPDIEIYSVDELFWMSPPHTTFSEAGRDREVHKTRDKGEISALPACGNRTQYSSLPSLRAISESRTGSDGLSLKK